jgi:phage major head subunit gpT-like protein
MIVNESSLNDLFVGFKAAFNTGFNSAEAYWQKIATRVPSTTSEEHYAWLGQFPRLREWVGDRHVKNLAAHDYRVKNKKFESTVAVERDKIEDDSFGVYSPLMQEIGFAAKTHPDELVFALLAAGFTELCYDGQYFFDTDHPVLVNGVETSVANMQAGGGTPWFVLDTRRPLKPAIFQERRGYDLKSMVEPTNEHVWKRDEYQYGVDARVNVGFGFWQTAFASKATLDDTNFNAAVAAMLAFKSDEGRPLGIMPNLLVVGPSNRSAAKTVIEAEQNAAGASNINFKAVEVLVVPWLS